MPGFKNRDFDADDEPYPSDLSSNGQWLYGSIYAGLILVGFSFGVWAGAAKPKPVEVAEAKPDPAEKPAPKAGTNAPAVPTSGAPSAHPTSSAGSAATGPKSTSADPSAKPVEIAGPKKDPDGRTAGTAAGTTPLGTTSPTGSNTTGSTPSTGSKPTGPSPQPKEPEPKKPAAKAVAFKEIAPVLRSYCGNCHGQAGKPKGGVDLRTVAAIMKGGDDGPLVKPGDPDKSPLYESIKAGRMPPDGKPGPSEKELMLIRDWIAGWAKERRRTVRRRRAARKD
ncbi:c-type cytochrome domain-containing protein [Frigoriglobus tundricola]|uniref:TolA protein n=1 Tax=Frigoriglobus tundricola TaxID=2774151 RepID=A0A6M5Z540_9BACT|nr:c-type cytochrome domain-containing protein [Frigoriglobus tundricola]QJX00927.1 Putative TolA protein [Frigoriglobus tundricola]